MSRVLSKFNFPMILCDPCGDSGLELDGKRCAKFVPYFRLEGWQGVASFKQVSVEIIHIACLVPCLASFSTASASVDNESDLDQ